MQNKKKDFILGYLMPSPLRQSVQAAPVCAVTIPLTDDCRSLQTSACHTETAPGLSDSLRKRISTAFFFAGYACFSLIFCVQPLLPDFVTYFHLTPAGASLALSVATWSMAASIMLTVILGRRFSRLSIITFSLFAAACAHFMACAAERWDLFLLARMLTGAAAGGLPATAMAFLAEETDPRHLGRLSGLFVSGAAFGGMMGRVGIGLLGAYFEWRGAMMALGATCVCSALIFAYLISGLRAAPSAKRPSPVNLSAHVDAWKAHLRHPTLRLLIFVPFFLNGAFVVLFNYAGFRLSLLPYALSRVQISLFFLFFIFGMLSSPICGALAPRFGAKRLLTGGLLLMAAGTTLTLFAPLPMIGAGLALATVGSFGAHSVASGAAGALARSNKGHATSLYYLFYYVGSGIAGTTGGVLWRAYGWHGAASLCFFLITCALAPAFALPLRHTEESSLQQRKK